MSAWRLPTKVEALDPIGIPSDKQRQSAHLGAGPGGRMWRLVRKETTLKTTTLRNLWAAVVVLGLGTGCGNTVQVKGRVTDGEGTQPQAVVAGAAPLGGSGTVGGGTPVRAKAMGGGGKDRKRPRPNSS